MLDSEGGYFHIEGKESASTRQYYLTNTPILVTEHLWADEGKIRIIDFAPRFEQYGRMFRPSCLIRIVQPIKGRVKIRVSCKPVAGWSKTPSSPRRFNSHLRFAQAKGEARLVSNVPLTYLEEEEYFFLDQPAFFAFLWDMPIEADLEQVCNDFLLKTKHYWETWVKHCSIPVLFQQEVIRSAITLKLHCYEDTGAILAATTTSLPEIPGAERNWDYRYCWLRDSYFTLNALHKLGHFEEMEGFLRFLINLVSLERDLAPVYQLDQKLPLPEILHTNWSGFENSRPVRSGNAAAAQIQHDIYGELILTFLPIYHDDRFAPLRSKQLDELMFWLGSQCMKFSGQPDAGLWELRGVQVEHTFTNLMCWAGLDRLLKLCQAKRIKLPDNRSCQLLEQKRQFAYDRVLHAVRDSIAYHSPVDPSLDASLLLLPILGFPDKSVNQQTVDAVSKGLSAGREALLFRYLRADDFGLPQDAFLVCSFWLAQSWSVLGQRDRGRRLLAEIIGYSNSLGLYSEHVGVKAPYAQRGNFPQTYTHVGQINAAFAVSPGWEEVL